MKINFGSKTWLYPQPVMIIGSYDENGTPDAMNAAWGGIIGDNNLAMCLSAGHKTVKNILKTGAFTVSPADEAHTAECDYLGIESANTCPDKLKKSGFTVTKSAFVNAPIINELPMALECKLISYDSDTCILTGEIINVCADEAVLTDGSIDPEKLKPITFDPVNSAYLALGKKTGNAFSDGLSLK